MPPTDESIRVMIESIVDTRMKAIMDELTGMSDLENSAVIANTSHRIITSGNPHQVTSEDLNLDQVPNVNFTAAVEANSLKVSNVTHTGAVTGDEELTITDKAIDIQHLNINDVPTPISFLRGDFKWRMIELDYYLLNPDFELWSYGYSFTDNGYTTDRMRASIGSSGTFVLSRAVFTIGQTDVPTTSKYFVNIHCDSDTVDGLIFEQRIPNVRRLAGRKITVSFYIKSTTPIELDTELIQVFGTGGSIEVADSKSYQSNSTWRKITHVFEIPTVDGKTIGTNDYTTIQFISLRSNSAEVSIDIAKVRMNDGDIDLDITQHPDIDRLLCQSYHQTIPSGVFMADTINSIVGNLHLTPAMNDHVLPELTVTSPLSIRDAQMVDHYQTNPQISMVNPDLPSLVQLNGFLGLTVGATYLLSQGSTGKIHIQSEI